ncbi:MAG: YhdP family protein [Betaproteobacteria bacterium]
MRALLRAGADFSPVLSRVVRYAGIAAIVAFAAFALLLLAVRLVVFPRVESYRDTLTAMLTAQLGQPVEIAALATGWDGWNPKIAIQGFRVREPIARGGATMMELPEVDLIVAWTSLPLFELRLKELVIDRPRLAIRRDRAGMLHVAGVEIDPAQASADSALTDWILRQPRILVRDALIFWNDDLRNAPQLVLDRVQFRLENRFGHHRFGIHGTPPAELAAPIDVRGDVTGASLRQWDKTAGRLYVRLDYADIAAWHDWLPLPVPIASGQGALRLWLDFAQGEARALTADLELADVKAKLSAELPELSLASLSGRAGWKLDASQREFFARKLAFVAADGRAVGPADFSLTLREPGGGAEPGGRLEFDRLQLEPLRELAAHLPLPDRVRTDLARYAPRGTLERGRLQWQGPADDPATFAASGDFHDLGLAAQDPLPGVRGVSGSFSATHAGGMLKLEARNAAFDLPAVFVTPVTFDTARAEASWERGVAQTSVRVERLEFANADAAGTASGTWRTRSGGAGEIDLNARLDRANPRQAWRYMPKGVADDTREWLKTAIGAGTVVDAKLRLAGDLAAFPFADGKSGQFVVTAKATDLGLDYAARWPAFTALDADIRVDRARLTIDATHGRVFGAEVGRVHAEIPDLAAATPMLSIDGDASGPMADFIRFVDASPLRDWTDRVLEGAEATGNGRLALKLALPLRAGTAAKVDGELTMTHAQLRLPGAPALTQVDGKVAFSEHDLRAHDIVAEVFGGPAKLGIARTDGRLNVTGAGTANLAALRREYPTPFTDRVSGSADWTITVNALADALTWVIESPLRGAVVDLPAPLGKTAGETVAFKVERRFSPARPGEDTIVGTYGRDVALALHRKLAAGGAASVDRALLSLGRAGERADAGRAERTGLWLRAEMPALNVDSWLAFQRREQAAAARGGEEALEFAGADLDVGALDAFGRRFNDLKVIARHAQGSWQLDLRGREIAGTATWSAAAAGAPNGRLVARLSRLTAPGAGELALPDSADPKAETVANSWPDVDVAADSFTSKGHDLGRIEILAQPRGAEWRIERLSLANDAGRIDADGAWRALGRQQQTKLDVALDVKDAGAFLVQFGLPDALQGAPTKIGGQLSWAGAPNEFDYPTLAGAFTVTVGAGRFTKLDPGMGKLLGVVSLQSLPRRVTLDFRDIFSDGFVFDQVTGNVRLQNGVMTTDDLKLVGLAAKVDIAGDADLAHETQRLSVKVQPALSMGVSAGAALLFLANPIIGAAVGAGALLAQKVLQDPIEQLFSYNYTVTGSWSDPVVVRSNARATASIGNTPPEGTTR